MEFERKFILEEIKRLKDSGRINYLGFEPSRDGLPFGKNSDCSQAAKMLVNEFVGNKNHDEEVHETMWKIYTRSIAFAPNESEELATGYANRSALLLHLEKYNDCLLDIDRALKITNSNALKVKLYCRQSECYFALQNGQEKESLGKAKLWLGKIDNAKEIKKLKQIVQKAEQLIKNSVADPLKKEKEYEISCDNNAFRISYNKKYGRHLVADRDISVGELLYTEKFYVTTVNTAKFYAYCSHCLAICWAAIPCDQCRCYMYCSEKCKKEAWQKYHDIECAAKFEKHRDDHDEYYIQLGLRALIMGFKEAGSIAKLKELTNEIDKCTDLKKKGLDKDGKLCSDSFRSMYSLSCSKSEKKVKYLVPEVLKVIVSLARYTDIFGQDFKYTNNVNLMKNEDAIFMASLFVRLSLLCIVNAFETMSANMVCEKTETMIDCMHTFCCSRGFNLSLFTSLINHSCDNNVDKFYTNDGRVVYYALQPIKKNSQIFSSYYCKYFKMWKAGRQELLSSTFEFKCDCIACTNDWPNIMQPYPDNPTPLVIALYFKHLKVIKKIDDEKVQRYSTNTIREFIKDTESLLTSPDQVRPTIAPDTFLWVLSLLIEHRYFTRLIVPNTCKNNPKK